MFRAKRRPSLQLSQLPDDVKHLEIKKECFAEERQILGQGSFGILN